MKLKEKLSEEYCQSKSPNPYSESIEEFRRIDIRNAYESGFEKAREMAANIARMNVTRTAITDIQIQQELVGNAACYAIAAEIVTLGEDNK